MYEQPHHSSSAVVLQPGLLCSDHAQHYRAHVLQVAGVGGNADPDCRPLLTLALQTAYLCIVPHSIIASCLSILLCSCCHISIGKIILLCNCYTSAMLEHDAWSVCKSFSDALQHCQGVSECHLIFRKTPLNAHQHSQNTCECSVVFFSCNDFGRVSFMTVLSVGLAMTKDEETPSVHVQLGSSDCSATVASCCLGAACAMDVQQHINLLLLDIPTVS